MVLGLKTNLAAEIEVEFERKALVPRQVETHPWVPDHK